MYTAEKRSPQIRPSVGMNGHTIFTQSMEVFSNQAAANSTTRHQVQDVFS